MGLVFVLWCVFWLVVALAFLCLAVDLLASVFGCCLECLLLLGWGLGFDCLLLVVVYLSA